MVLQATERPAGVNGLDVAGLRPFDLVIPFTIQKGEITGDQRAQGWGGVGSGSGRPVRVGVRVRLTGSS